MALPINVEELISGRIIEPERIVYRRDYNPDEVIPTICAFANDIENTGGGYIVIGVEEENGCPVAKGIDKDRVDEIIEDLHKYSRFIEPYYAPVIEPVLFQGVWVIIVWVSGGFGRPYKAPKEVTKNQSIKQYYIRKFSSTVVADRNEERELFYVSSNIPFDDRENLAADVSDLSASLMLEHLQEVGSDLYGLSIKKDALSIARDMQLVGGSEECLKPRNVGLLMFSMNTEKYFRNARIEVVDIPKATGEGMTEKVFTGPIQYQLRNALSYIKGYVISERVFKIDGQPEAKRITNYPYKAVEEILSNAVYHRSYQIQEPIVVRITPLSMEITSYPGFDRSITDEKIKRYDFRAKVYRNRRIGDFLKELHLIEGRNTGFPTALKALKDNGSERFKIEMDKERQYLSVIIPIHPSFRSKVTKKADDYENKIIEIIEGTPLTITEISKSLGYKGITKRLRVTIDQMVLEGRVDKKLMGVDIVYSSNR
ncbi:MAG: RNA-binding domain-containing protein [Candidatus Ornithospirochaeta sp.]